MTFDVAIIGAGMSGLAAGVRLAHFGKKVCIVERHTVWGGLNSFYKKAGHHYDTGLHAMTNWVPPGHKGARLPLQRIFRQLRIRPEELALEPQSYSEIIFPSCKLRFENGLDVLSEEIRRKFPEEIDGFLALAAKLEEYPEALAELPKMSGRKILTEYLHDPLLIEMLLCPLLFYGSAEEDDVDLGQLTILFNSIFREGFCRPRDGVKPVIFSLVRRFKEAGGALHKNDGVAKIQVENGRATHLELDSGERISAGLIISSAGFVETERLRSDRSPQTAQASIGRVAFTETVFVLDRSPKNFGFLPSICFYSLDDRLSYRAPLETPVDVRSGVICCPDNFAHQPPLDDHRLRITHLANPDVWLGLDQERYQQAKNEWLRRSSKVLEGIAGPFTDHIVAVDSFTPRTVKQYTGHENGAVYGSPNKQRSGRTDLPNLFLTGTDQGLLGIVGALLSGIAVANTYGMS